MPLVREKQIVVFRHALCGCVIARKLQLRSGIEQATQGITVWFKAARIKTKAHHLRIAKRLSFYNL
jgi:hypothetical protein